MSNRMADNAFTGAAMLATAGTAASSFTLSAPSLEDQPLGLLALRMVTN